MTSQDQFQGGNEGTLDWTQDYLEEKQVERGCVKAFENVFLLRSQGNRDVEKDLGV